MMGMDLRLSSSLIHFVTSRPETSRELQRLHAVLGLQNVVAVRLDQIVEELHVELVVLDDQDRLLGRAAALFLRRHLLPLKH
jgi:hypothetical protein